MPLAWGFESPPAQEFKTELYARFNFYAGASQLLGLRGGREGRSDVRVLPKAKASTARPGPEAFSVRKMTEGRAKLFPLRKNLKPSFMLGF